MKPRLLDLYSGAGGCAVGYHRAGFDVVGVDIAPQPRYPFTFIQADAMEFLETLLIGAWAGNSEHAYTLNDFDAIHASPPCQQFSVAKRLNATCNHPDLIEPTREAIIATGLPYVIENVPGCPLITPALVCGLALGLNVKRHRIFESSSFLFSTTCPAGHRGNWLTNFGNDIFVRRERQRWVTVCGGGAPAKADNRRRATVADCRVAMGIDWMTRDELSQAIPPAYTEFVGKQLIRVCQRELLEAIA